MGDGGEPFLFEKRKGSPAPPPKENQSDRLHAAGPVLLERFVSIMGKSGRTAPGFSVDIGILYLVATPSGTLETTFLYRRMNRKAVTMAEATSAMG